jgi:hypothetical protein
MNRAISSAERGGGYAALAEKCCSTASGPALERGVEFLARKAGEGDADAAGALKAVAIVNSGKLHYAALTGCGGWCDWNARAERALGGVLRKAADKGEDEFGKAFSLVVSAPAYWAVVAKHEDYYCKHYSPSVRANRLFSGESLMSGLFSGAFGEAAGRGWLGCVEKMVERAEGEGLAEPALEAAESALAREVGGGSLKGEAEIRAKGMMAEFRKRLGMEADKSFRRACAELDAAIAESRIEGSVPQVRFPFGPLGPL